MTFRYDVEWERKRRLQLESFHSRSVEELQEELFLLDEIERVSETLPQIVEERERIMMMYHNGVDRVTKEGAQLTLMETINGGSSTINNSSGARRKSIAVTQKSGVQTGTPLSSSQVRRDRKRSIPSVPSSHTTSAESVSSKTSTGPGRKPKPISYPTNLTSTTLTPIRVGLCRHVDKLMLDYGVPLKPTIATPEVIAKYNELRLLLAELAEAKKALESLGQNPN